VIDYKLTDLQLDIMSVLWKRGEASVGEVRDALKPGRDLAHTTVSTMLSRLEKKGLLRHRVDGRQFLYAPAVEAARVQRSVMSDLSDVMDRLFGGDVTDAVSHLLAASDVNAEDLARVRKLIERKEAELKKRGDEK
jgi:BlaI family transcriptional regulator, penicillinase repressor